jgi:hypothetical protein
MTRLWGILFIALVCGAEQPDCVLEYSLASGQRSRAFDNRTRGCNTWVLTVSGSGAGTFTVGADRANDNNGAPDAWTGGFGTFTVMTADPTQGGTNPCSLTPVCTVELFAYWPWVSVNFSAGTTSRVQGSLLGWRGKQSWSQPIWRDGAGTPRQPRTSTNNESIAVGPTPTGNGVTGNPVLIASRDSAGNVRPLATNTSGNLSLGINGNGADGISNGQGLFMPDSAGASAFPQIWLMGYNGVTWDRVRVCNSSAVVSVTAGATTEIVPLIAGRQVNVCAWSVSPGTAASARWVSGTGVNCAGATTNMTGAIFLAAGTPWQVGSGSGTLFRTTSGHALCLNAGAGGNIDGVVTYTQ